MILYKIKYHFLCNIKKFFLRFNKRITIKKRVTWRRHFSVIVEKGGSVVIEKDCFFNNDCSIVSYGKIFIGEGSIFGENVKIYDCNHKFNKPNIPIKEQGFSIGEVTIGKHCWIGSNVTILKGSVIGDNCVIGAGCVISGIVPSNTLVKIHEKSYQSEQIRVNG